VSSSSQQQQPSTLLYCFVASKVFGKPLHKFDISPALFGFLKLIKKWGFNSSHVLMNKYLST
jgi:hypothetical protein